MTASRTRTTLVVCAAAFLTLQLSLAYAIPIVNLEIPDPQILPWEQFDIKVLVDAVLWPDELLAFGFDLDYDPSWTWDGATVGPGFTDDSALWPDTDVAGSAFPGVTGTDILLATLSFTPSQAGEFDFSIITDPLDPDFGLSEGLITFDYPAVDITTTTSVDVVPEASTLLLFGSGLLGLLPFARRRFMKSR